jgi:hypothetical protein
MGGKDSGGGGDPNAETMRQFQMQGQRDAAAASAKQKAASEEPTKEPAKEPPVTEATQLPPEAVVPGSENLTGLGDALVGGMSAGQSKQVADQTARVAANPSTYAPGFDPYTGTFTGQGPYKTPGGGGQV